MREVEGNGSGTGGNWQRRRFAAWLKDAFAGNRMSCYLEPARYLQHANAG
jgi:hypothetical protein